MHVLFERSKKCAHIDRALFAKCSGVQKSEGPNPVASDWSRAGRGFNKFRAGTRVPTVRAQKHSGSRRILTSEWM